MKLIAFIVCTFTLSLSAQGWWTISTGTMQNYALGNEIGGDRIYTAQKAAQTTRINYGLGGGQKVFIGGQYFFSDSSPFVLGITISYLQGNTERYAETENDSNQYLSYTTLQNRQIVINPSIGLKYHIGKTKHITSIGLISPLLMRTNEQTYWQVAGEQQGQEERNIRYKYSPGLFLHHSVQLVKKGPISINVSGEIGILSPSRKTKIVKDYWDINGRQLMDVFPDLAQRELEYINPNTLEQGQRLNDPAFNPLKYNPNNRLQAFEYNENMSYAGIGIHINYQILRK